MKVVDNVEKTTEKTAISINIDENIAFIKAKFKGCNDIVYREFNTGGEQGIRFFLAYIDGMSDKVLLDNFLLLPVMITTREAPPSFEEIKQKIFDVVLKSAMPLSDLKEEDGLEVLLDTMLSGDSVLIIDGYDKGLKIASRSWPVRGVTDPASETVLRGSRDGFSETMRVNTALVRRRIRDYSFKVKQMQVGTRSKTDIAVMYIEDIADGELVAKVLDKIEGINIDAILDSGYVQQFLEERQITPFPQVQATERPDVVAAALYEGRVSIIVDNSPYALIVPVTLNTFFQSAEDFYSRAGIASFLRILRVLGAIVSLTAPALYIAMVSFHPGIIPTRLVLFLAATREGVPFSAFVEAILMEITFELLREAGVRLPRPIGTTIGIVGGLVIGQAAVSAQLVGPVMLIIVAITAIASFSIPNYEISAALRLLRFFIMICAAIFGLYGIMLAYFIIIIHMTNLKSFGVYYLEPITPLRLSDLKDSVFVRLPWKYMNKRPEVYGARNKVRQKVR